MTQVNKDAIDAIAALAVKAHGPHEPIALDGLHRPSIILANGESLVNVEPLMAGRARYRTTMVTTSIADFIEYVRHRNNYTALSELARTPVFLDPVFMAAQAVFNLGSVTAPGHGDDTATLNMQKTAAYAALLAVKDKRLSQAELAEFIEDWCDRIAAFRTGDDHEPVQFPLSHAVTAIRQVTVKVLSEGDSAVSNFAEQRSTLERVEVSAKNTLPAGLSFVAEPYAGLQPVTFSLRVSAITGGDKPAFTLRIVREGDVLERIAQDFKAVLAAGVSEFAVLTIGTLKLAP